MRLATRYVLSQETSMSSPDSVRRSILGTISFAVSAALAGIAVGAMPSDSARSAAMSLRTFNPALLCRPQTTAALQTRVAKRVQSGRAP